MILKQKKRKQIAKFQIAGNFDTQITDNEDNGYKGTACPHRLFCYNTRNVTSYINCLPMEAAVGTREKFLYTQYVVISGAIIFNIPHNDCSNYRCHGPGRVQAFRAQNPGPKPEPLQFGLFGLFGP